jgi:pSer/pThr/pTyr-binding forkhead associated (FHA) protein
LKQATYAADHPRGAQFAERRSGFEGERMARPRLVLCGLGKRVEGLRWESEARLRIGRNNSLEIVVNDPSISREHAEILLTPEGWLARDLGSTNGTLLNNMRLDGAGRLLRSNDIVTFGRVAGGRSERIASVRDHPRDRNVL